MNKTIILALSIAGASFGCADEVATPVVAEEAAVSAVIVDKAVDVVAEDIITEQAIDIATGEGLEVITDKADDKADDKIIVTTTVE